MTPETLMQPRYKVIADYPESSHEVGVILSPMYYTSTNNKSALKRLDKICNL